MKDKVFCVSCRKEVPIRDWHVYGCRCINCYLEEDVFVKKDVKDENMCLFGT